MHRRFLVSVMVGAFAVLATGVADAAPEIGSVRLVKVWAYGTPPQSDRHPLFKADDIYANELLETVEKGAMHVRFLDETELRLGSSSRVELNEYIYDPDTNAGEAAMKLVIGAFRITTGLMQSEGIEVTTPVLAIGVRGTDFLVDVEEDGTTTVTVLAGMVTLSPVAGGPSTSVDEGNVASVNAAGQVSVSRASPSPDPGLTDGAGISGPTGEGKSSEGGGGGGKNGGSSP